MSGRTKPELWEQAKRDAVKQLGGHSARAMQLAGRLYRERGGGYTSKKTPQQISLTTWTKQDWRTKSGLPSLVTGERYLPSKIISALTPQEYALTSKAKKEGMARGRQFVPQPKSIVKKIKTLKNK